eukprot:6205152-Pleurochrysis_carterae.AAC.2
MSVRGPYAVYHKYYYRKYAQHNLRADEKPNKQSKLVVTLASEIHSPLSRKGRLRLLRQDHEWQRHQPLLFRTVHL